ncbi:allatostatin-A receptor-like [Gigantopelta aegis]|uniref:allatostatin-A receptor-like n=1 Tax=Gigantopelta aegis TaxID=1735272 RepID=UPI001B889203|nr:allatostatin-A receptor-like [Gigantopelta aegis]
MSLPHRDYTQIPAVTFMIVILYVAIIVLAITGNFLVIMTVWRNKHMHTVTNYYIVNLAISDLLVSSIVMPLKLLEYTAPCHWHVFGSDALCSVLYYLLPIFVFASVLTLVAISLERYYAIVYPLSAMKLNSKSRTRKIIAVTWIIPIILASPYTYCRSYAFDINSDLGQISRQICNDRFDEIDVAIYGEEAFGSGQFRRGFFIFLFLAVYVIPMTLILVTCIKIAVCLLQPISFKRSPVLGRKDASRRKHEENKRKVARMVIVIAVAFIVSWSPQYLVSIISQIQSIHGDTFLREGNFLFTMLMTHLCGFLNSCINPFVYTVMSEKFRRSFKQILGAIFCCCWTRNIFRYRDSFRDSRSCPYTTTIRQSLEDIGEGMDVPMNDVPSSGGSSNEGSNSNRVHRIFSKNTDEMSHILSKSKQKRNDHGRRHNKMSSKSNKRYEIMLKCMKKKTNDIISSSKREENIKMQVKYTLPPVENKIAILDNAESYGGDSLAEVLNCQEIVNDICSESDGSERGIRISSDQIDAIRKEHESSLGEPVSEDDKRFTIVSNGHIRNGNCVQL